MIKKPNSIRNKAKRRRRERNTHQHNYPEMRRLLQKTIFILISLCRMKTPWQAVTHLVILLIKFLTKKGLLIPNLLKILKNFKSRSDPFLQWIKKVRCFRKMNRSRKRTKIEALHLQEDKTQTTSSPTLLMTILILIVNYLI